jgi:hypothetical protein
MPPDTNPYESPATTAGVQATATASARSQLVPVAIALLVPSILHITGGLFYFVFVYSLSADPDADPLETHMMTVYCLYYAISMLYCLVIASGAYTMLRMRSYTWAMTVCILAVIPVVGPCYILAVPAGIWGILVLRRPDVRKSFAEA